MIWLATAMVALVVVLSVAWGNRHPGRHAERYPCECWRQRLRDWWAWQRARR